jgi:hypothetical protein
MPSPAVDLDALLAANRKQAPGPRCSVCRALAAMDEPTRAKMQAALDDGEGYSGESLGKVFTALGHRMTGSPVDRHRRGGCRQP